MIFSLILATYGRLNEIDSLFESLVSQSIGTKHFEIILIDQNETDNLSSIVNKYSNKLIINHIRSNRKGLSFNRNIGLEVARGDYVCFPDDDCTYYPDTLEIAYKHLKNSRAMAVFGAIRDRVSAEDIIRKWPKCKKRINRYNFFHLYSSITIFVRKNELKFNENLGVGCYFGSYEDADYTYKLLKKYGECCYYPDIQVWHPKAGLTQYNKAKNWSYGLGFGALCAEYKFDIFIFRLFILSLGYHLSFALLAAFKGDAETFKKRLDAFASRITGYIEYLTK